MGLRPLSELVRWVSIAKAFLLILSVSILAVALGGVLLYDYPAAHLGVGETDWSSFSGFGDDGKTYSVVAEYSQGSEGREEMVYTQYSNGSRVTEVRAVGSGNLSRGDGVVRYTTVQTDGVRYEVEEYRDGYDPEVIEPDVYYDANSNIVYEREEYNETDIGPGYPSIFKGIFSGLSYTRNGTHTWKGRAYARYDVLDQRDVLGVLTGADEATGYVLLNDDNEVRYAKVSAADGSNPLIYKTYPGAVTQSHSSVRTVEGMFTYEPAQREIHAYYQGGYVLLTSSSQWTPSVNITVALVDRADDKTKTDRLEAGELVFEERNGNYIAYLKIGGEEVSLTKDRVQNGSGEIYVGGYPKPIIVFDRKGINVYEVPIEPKSALGSLYSVTASHLLPKNGGGRVLRVDDLEMGEMFSRNDSVTITVVNATKTRSITKKKNELSNNRFYLTRTPEGLEVENSDGIVTHVTPSKGFSERRFVANATLEVTADGLPIVRKPVPERATRASSEPLDELLTGVGIHLYDTPPDGSMLGHGRRIRSMDWGGHTLLKVHSWDYDTLRVSGGEDMGFPSVIHEDQTGYYRLRDGERFRVETGDGRTLHEGVADGTETVSS